MPATEWPMGDIPKRFESVFSTGSAYGVRVPGCRLQSLGWWNSGRRLRPVGSSPTHQLQFMAQVLTRLSTTVIVTIGRDT